jgi:2,4-dienoyl-CoA reductase-like NADH-dependent reductase (Old Yellow Enzyme family)
VFAEAAAVDAHGRISPGDLGIWKDEHVEPLQRVTRFIASQGAVPGIQLAHAGRKASTGIPWITNKPLGEQDGGWKPVGPSAVPFAEGYATPHVLTTEDIRQMEKAFGAAAGSRWSRSTRPMDT